MISLISKKPSPKIMKMSSKPFLSGLLALGVCGSIVAAPKATFEKPHIIIETDLGGDPDDEASMVRFLLYACDFEIDGIVLTNSETRHGISGRDLFDRYLEAYEKVLPNLRKHRSDYPSVEKLREVAKVAYRVEKARDPAGAEFLIEVADRKLPHRTWYLNWGTDSSMRLAFELVNEKRGVAGLTDFCRQFHNSSLGHGTPPNSRRDRFARTEMREALREGGMVVVNQSSGGSQDFDKWYHQMGGHHHRGGNLRQRGHHR